MLIDSGVEDSAIWEHVFLRKPSAKYRFFLVEYIAQVGAHMQNTRYLYSGGGAQRATRNNKLAYIERQEINIGMRFETILNLSVW